MTHLEIALRLIKAQEKLLAAYRTNSKPSGKTLDDVHYCKKWLTDAGLMGVVAGD